MKRLLIILALALVPVASSAQVSAQTPQSDKGLLITPLRSSVTVTPGSSKTASFTVANRTEKPLTVQLFDRQFSVTDYTYGYQFNTPRPDLVKIASPDIELRSGESRKVTYTIDAPANLTPGGQYYTLFASATLQASEPITIQAATLLYITIDGELEKSTSLQSSSIQHFSFGGDFSYTLQALDTGNVHYFVYAAGVLQGATAKQADSPTTHMLMPNAIRTIKGTIAAPTLPGIYKAEYGYRTDSGQQVLATATVFYVPPWSVALLLLLVLVFLRITSRKKQARTPADSDAVQANSES